MPPGSPCCTVFLLIMYDNGLCTSTCKAPHNSIFAICYNDFELTKDSQRSMDSIIASNCVNAPQIELELNLRK